MHSKAFAESEDPKKWIGLGDYIQLLTKINKLWRCDYTKEKGLD